MSATVLVVEDDPRSVKLLELILGSRGFQTVIARNGTEALDMLRSQRFDLIVLDLMLPEVDGFEVMRQVRDDPALSEAPIVITSATADPISRQAAADLGADAYLTKPFHKAALLDAIDSLMGSDL